MTTITVKRTVTIKRDRKFNFALGVKRIFNSLNEYFELESGSMKFFFYGFAGICLTGIAVCINALLSI